MEKYRKKPSVVEAIQWTGENLEEVKEFISEDKFVINPFSNKITGQTEHMLLIKNSEGELIAAPGDFITKSVEGEFYPCNPDIFKKTYEAIKK